MSRIGAGGLSCAAFPGIRWAFAYVFGEDGKAELNLESPCWSNSYCSSAITKLPQK